MNNFSRFLVPLLLLIPIYFAQSSVSMAAAMATYLFMLFNDSKKVFVWLFSLILIGGVCYLGNDIGKASGMYKDRINLWKVTLRDALKHPVMGWGLDSFRNVGEFKPFMYFKNAMTEESRAVPLSAIKIFQESGKMPPLDGFVKEGDMIDPWDNPHNEYVGLLYEFGMVGVLIFGCLVSNIWTRFSFNDLELMTLMGFFIGILIISIAQFPFHVARIGVFIPIMLACYYKLTDPQEA